MSENSEHRRVVQLPADVALHARPAGLLVRAAAALPAQVVLNANGKTAKASSILQVLALGAEGGSSVEVVASGAGASDALDTIARLLESLTV
jgi:phosphoenolpyruvate---glycerone phosphotransferase subunit DhaM